MESEILSATFSIEGNSVARPFPLNSGFDRSDTRGCQAGIRALSTLRPKLTWISFPEDYDLEVMAKFCHQVAEHQIYYENFFVIAHPWNSSFWNHNLVTSLIDQHSLSYYKVDLSVYDSSLDKTKSYACCVIFRKDL